MKTDSPANREHRYGLLDSVRGVLIVGMIVYHTLFDYALLFGAGADAPFMKYADIVRDFGAACFIFLSGWCFHLSRNNIRKGLVLFSGGLVITGVTFLFNRDNFVIFGILTLMGTAKLLLSALHRLLKRIPAAAGCAASFFLFLLFFSCNYGYAGYGGFVLFRWPQFLYRNYVTAFFGFPFNGFSSADYFSLLPWFFIGLCGYFAYRAAQGKPRIPRLLAIRVPVLHAIGRNSLPIYLLHQPVIYFFLWIINKIFL